MIIYSKPRKDDILETYTKDVSFASFACSFAFKPHNYMSICLAGTPHPFMYRTPRDNFIVYCSGNSYYNHCYCQRTYNCNVYEECYGDYTIGPIFSLYTRTTYTSPIANWIETLCNPLIKYTPNASFEAIYCYCTMISAGSSVVTCVNFGASKTCIGSCLTKFKITYKYTGTHYEVYLNDVLKQCCTNDTNFTKHQIELISSNSGTATCYITAFCAFPICWKTCCGNIYYKCD